MTPTPEQIAEKEAWIAEHVMGWRWWLGLFHPYTDPAANQEVLGKCAEKLERKDGSVDISKCGKEWDVCAKMKTEYDDYCEHESSGNTLPAAICEFAIKLFGKDKP